MATTMRLIAKSVLGTATSEVTFSSIPGTGYTDLMLVWSSRSTNLDGGGTNIRLNGTTTGYSERLLYGTGSAAASTSTTTQTSFVWSLNNPDRRTANTFASGQAYIPNYAGSTNKSVSIESVNEGNQTASDIYLVAGLWSNTAAITEVKFISSSDNFAANSSFFLYGIKSA